MIAKTKRKSSKPRGVRWERAKTINIPIPRTGTKFQQYIESPPRPCEVSASFSFLPLPRGVGYLWRLKLDTPLFHSDDPGADERRPVASIETATRSALGSLLRLLRQECELRRKSKQPEIAAAVAAAVGHVERFAEHFEKTGKYLVQATKTRLKSLHAGKRPNLIAAVHEKAARESGAPGPQISKSPNHQISKSTRPQRRIDQPHAEPGPGMFGRDSGSTVAGDPGPIARALFDGAINAASGKAVTRAQKSAWQRFEEAQKGATRGAAADAPTGPTGVFAPLKSRRGNDLERRLVVTADDPLAAGERKTLQECEQTIAANVQGFREVGNALFTINKGRLYRETHPTFDAYLRERWDMGRAYAHRLIASAEVVRDLSPTGEKRGGAKLPPIVPATESQARPLAKLDTTDRKAVWRQVQKAAPKKDGRPIITAQLVEAKVREYTMTGDEAERRAERKEPRIDTDAHGKGNQAAPAEPPAAAAAAELPPKAVESFAALRNNVEAISMMWRDDADVHRELGKLLEELARLMRVRCVPIWTRQAKAARKAK